MLLSCGAFPQAGIGTQKKQEAEFTCVKQKFVKNGTLLSIC